MKSRSEWRKTAEKYLGVPYVWGGEAKETGMDCSGFVDRVLWDMEFSLPRLTAQGLYNKYKANAMKKVDCREGDLLFFGTSTGHITHVAFYSDSNKMLESGGGGSANTSLSNAGVGVRYREIRNDLVACVRMNYGETEGKNSMTFDVGLIRKGSKGNDVLLAQEILKARGIYKGNLDKDFGSQTEAAAKEYQRQRIANGADMGCGKTPDGEIGEKTWADMLAT